MPNTSQRTNPELGRANRRRVLAEILFNAPISRKEIADQSGLTGATVSRICRDLVDAGLLTEYTSDIPQQRSGRRMIELTLNPDGAYFIGIGINAFVQWVSIFGPNHHVVAYQELSLESLADPQAVMGQMFQHAEQMINHSGIPRHKLVGGGVAIAGVIDPESGTLLFSPSLEWGELELGKITQERLGIPICVETFPNTLNLAENRFGIAKHCANVVLVNVSLHLGGSLLLDNQLRRGRNFGAGLIGDLSAAPSENNRGEKRLDEVAAGIAVMEAVSGRKPTASGRNAATELLQLRKTAIAGNTAINNAFSDAGKRLSHSLKLIDTLLQPDMIIIAGPISSIPAYIDGILSNLPKHDKALLSVSEMDNPQALRLLIYNEFLVRQDIDLQALNR